MKRKDNSRGGTQQPNNSPPAARKRHRNDAGEDTDVQHIQEQATTDASGLPAHLVNGSAPPQQTTASAPEQTPPSTARPVAHHHTPLTFAPILPQTNRTSNSQPALPHKAPTDAHTAIDFLTARCVGLVRTPVAPPSPQHTGPTSASHTQQPRPPAPWSMARVALETMPLRPTLERQLTSLVDVLEGVVREGSSLSALVMGPKASGKSLLVERAVARVCAAHNENPQGDKAVGVVRLSGLLHLEDRVAFSEAARQLCSEFDQPFSRTATYDENLLFFRKMLSSLHASMKKVIFIIDGFERFAKQRGKQTLLYNLLDELQHSNVEAGVIGITCAQDIMDLMEKRVKSRFSHRRIIVSSPLHFEVPNPSAPAAVGASRRSAATDSNPEPPVQHEDTPLGMLQDMLCLPTHNTCGEAQQHSQQGASGSVRGGWEGGAHASGGNGGGSGGGSGGGGNRSARVSREAAGRGQAGSVGQTGGRTAAGASASAAANGVEANGGGSGGREAERARLSAACLAALPVWQSPDFVARHNQAVKSCLQDVGVKTVLSSMFNTQLSSSKLSTIARMALAEWDRELQQQQRQQQQQQQQAGVGDMAEREQALQQQQQQPSHPALLQPTTPRSARKRPRTAPDPDQDPDRDHQLHLGPDPDYQPQGQGNGSAPVLLLQPRHVIAGCQSLRAADSMVRLVCDLSDLQLYLLAGMVRLSAKKHAMYNFEMVWDECKNKQDSSGILRTLKENEKAAWRAFEALVDSGVAFYSNQAAEAKGRNMKYAGAVLRLTSSEVEEGLAAHRSCPDEIIRFIRMET